MYQILHTQNGEMIRRTSDGAAIPEDLANTDYQRFLAWVAEGGTPEVIE